MVQYRKTQDIIESVVDAKVRKDAHAVLNVHLLLQSDECRDHESTEAAVNTQHSFRAPARAFHAEEPFGTTDVDDRFSTKIQRQVQRFQLLTAQSLVVCHLGAARHLVVRTTADEPTA